MDLANKISSMATAAIHGLEHETAEHAHLFPVFATSSFTFDSAQQGMNRFSGKEKGFTYSRFGNPTTQAAAKLIAHLETLGLQDESGKPLQAEALLTASGQAAMAVMMMANVSAGETILSNSSIYGGTHEFLKDLLPRFDVQCRFVNMNELDKVEDVLKEDASVKLLHLETPANPSMQCIDIEAICAVAKRYNKLVTIDNTFATPYLQQPFRYGVDYIFHSTTKFLNGHGNAIGGILIGRNIEMMKERVYQTYKLLGCNSNPFDAFLLMQGVKTLAARMDRHCSNAEQIANFLSDHPAVGKVNYNGLPTHPGYEISKKQMRHPGAVLSFELKDGFDHSVNFINRLRICVRAVSLGTTDTLVSHPASMSHAGMKKEQRLAAGIPDGLIRMSVGLEDITDLLKDLEQALQLGYEKNEH
ncbi:MAG: aminotransferase class I/II-fold pyridoxal phosphate-dependent enzyme [Chitinophagaceae bacterium]|nr:aminotransferase class I/II-fold pyridoxal phosphate-dependent enzyme [Chitinophagaceae bacterium]